MNNRAPPRSPPAARFFIDRCRKPERDGARAGTARPGRNPPTLFCVWLAGRDSENGHEAIAVIDPLELGVALFGALFLSA